MLFVCLMGLALAFSACASSGPAASEMNPPYWVQNPYTRYNREEYFAVVGSGNTRQDAERNAMSNLISQFGQTILVNTRVSTIYREIVRDDAVNWSEITTSEVIIALSAGMDNLVGVEFADAWMDTKGTHYVTAVLNKSRAIRDYTQMVNANLIIIDKLTDISPYEKYTLTGYAHFQLAASIADMTVAYGNLLRQIGLPLQQIENGDYYRLEAQNIINAIQVNISIQNDKSGRIEAAFTRAFHDQGFNSGTNNVHYVLEVDINAESVEYPGNPNKYTRIELNANLVDTRLQISLLPYNFTDRQGHITQTEADNRAYLAAEGKIEEEYRIILNEFLMFLIPQTHIKTNGGLF